MALDPNDPVDAIALAWTVERPGTQVDSIGVVTRIWHAAKLLGEDRTRTLAAAGADAAILDLLSVLRRSGPPYRLTTRELTELTLVSAGAISQRVARAERDGLVTRTTRADGSRKVDVALTPAGHAMVERLVDRVLGREAELVSALSAAQQAQLAELLRQLLAGLHAELGDQRLGQVGD
ncbi:MarR family winged helix-turn-helix transcriptional regulator [Amycolatopsis sp. 195334CR]|uniref:MarR family winged helix-turn-helix transcriptional regulator n=1 Tax=Amycolatopsis sp. 195334CR TaxID=2814588 RepID=UPI001A8C87C1|nr:MarR family transcriptional regulator [Amycolatopsis sp. 195334CR]MBN6037630.1 MarR family transcriptional regulator [Amycolatopsis sp. 195334CR]